MANPSKQLLRFDHREIAVLFSLFIFVSLLMFTVGILVGKGLAQAKLDANAPMSSALSLSPTNVAHDAHHEEVAAAHAPAHESAERAPSAVNEEKKAEEPAPLELVPQKQATKQLTGGSLREPKLTKEAQKAMSNPKIQNLLETAPGERARQLASGKIPDSFAKGLFTVQVGSYPNEQDAQDRVEALKKLGFPHAYAMATELGEPKKTWYRVGLGHFKDSQSAELSGKILQQRGEVKNYIVRKTDTSG